jgi:hypothetical protein
MLVNCPCKDTTSNKHKIRCNACNNLQHKTCIQRNLNMPIYHCINCQLKKMDPFIKELQNILSPTLISYKKENSCYNIKFACNFPSIIEEQTKKQINSSNSNQILRCFMLRCLRIDNNGFEHHWPYNFMLKINGVVIKTLSHPKNIIRSTTRKDWPIVFCQKKEDIQKKNYHKFPLDQLFIYSDLFINDKYNEITFINKVADNPKDDYSYVLSFDYVEILKDANDIINFVPKISDINLLKQLRTLAINNKNSLDDLNVNIGNLIINYLNS